MLNTHLLAFWDVASRHARIACAYASRKTSILQAILSYFIGKSLDRWLYLRANQHAVASAGFIERPGSGWEIVVYYTAVSTIVWIVSCLIRQCLREKTTVVWTSLATLSIITAAVWVSATILVPRVGVDPLIHG